METCDKQQKRKRKFLQAWLSDDRYKSWISQIPSDNTLFHCNVCNKSFSCSSSHVSRHADSACHKNKICTSLNEDMNKEHRTKKFQPQWLEIDQFKSWLREIPHDAKSFSCITCNKTITTGLSDIYRHAESKIHKKNSGNSDIVSKSIEDLNTQINEPPLTFDERKKLLKSNMQHLLPKKIFLIKLQQKFLNFFNK